MKDQLEALMQAADLDGVWITGDPEANPAVRYFVGDAHVSHVNIMLKPGETGVLMHSPMEGEEAARTGLRTMETDLGEWRRQLEAAKGDETAAEAAMIAQAFGQTGLSGSVAVYGQIEIGKAYRLLDELKTRLADIEFVVPEKQRDVLKLARMTKDADELAIIQRIGDITTEVIALTAELFRRCRRADGVLLDESNGPLTIGEVKRRIHLWLAERGAESPTGPILAQGRDGAIGHSVGTDHDPVRVASPIVFDLYPRQRGGGYYFDFTRTWCIDEVPPEVQKLYDDVMRVYNEVLPMLVAGASPMALENEVCDRFEALGHATLRVNANTKDGYIHSLAHGVGLDIHEPPVFRHYEEKEGQKLAPGMVVTFEPGLYYPKRDMGMRIEDAVLITESGPPQVVAPYPHELLLSPAGG